MARRNLDYLYATDKQEWYLKLLYNKCSAYHVPMDYNPMPKHGRKLLKSEATESIQMLLRCIETHKANGGRFL